MTLYEAFAGLADPRRAEGKRIQLEQLLALVVIANLCGHYGYRPVARFCQSHQQLLSQQFELKHGVPSYVTFRTVLTKLEKQIFLGTIGLNLHRQSGQDSITEGQIKFGSNVKEIKELNGPAL